MIRTATRDDLDALRALFARANDAPYDLGVVAEEKCFGMGISGAPRVRVYGDFLGAAVTCGKYLRVIAVDRAERRRGIGTALLDDSGASVIAAEPGNYFMPGVIDGAFFERRGFRTGARTNNLHCELPAAEPAAATQRLRTNAAGGGGAPLSSEDRERLLAFVEHEFGRTWRFECERAAGLIHVEHDGEIAGFAAIEANNRGLGTFGPTGVAKTLRGRGLGRELLLAALGDLRRLGFRRAIIPWTDAIDFYRRSCGAEPAHEFTAMLK
jgi:N-acetylglutamate synthase-like GNAT family acetyltransferase